MAEVVLVQLGELAALPGMPSDTKLRQIIRDHPDFPVVSFGKNGVSYEIDLERAIAWIRDHREKELEAQRARAGEVRQFALDLLGPDAASDPAKEGLSTIERKQLLEEELVTMKVQERRGELIRKASVEAALASVIVKDAQRRSSFAARLSKRIELSRDIIAALEALQDLDRKAFARELGQLSETADVDATPGADPAV